MAPGAAIAASMPQALPSPAEHCRCPSFSLWWHASSRPGVGYLIYLIYLDVRDPQRVADVGVVLHLDGGS
jgi:hypothetical protein